MYFKNRETPTNIRFIQHYLAIKAARAQQGRVKNIWAIGGSNDYNIGIFVKTVQLNK